MKAVRILVTSLVALAVAVGIYRLAWLPFRCDLEAKRAMVQTDYATRVADEYNAVIAARENLAMLAACTEHCPWDVRGLFAAAWNLRILKRYEHAIATYQEALKYDRRPEVYAELGNAHLEAGNETAAMEALLQAARFDRFVLTRVARPDIKERIEKQLESEKQTQ
jgi:tetratricopeptide (TPR) repeat protein